MATRLTEKYNEAQNKEVLFAEIEARRKEGREIPGISATSLRPDMEAALELDDDAPDQPRAPLPPLKSSSLPQITDPDKVEIPTAPGDAPKDEDYTDGAFTNSLDGEPYALCIVDDAESVDGKTHFAKNSRHFWNGTKAQFKEIFDKE
jgi:hypothetical protein